MEGRREEMGDLFISVSRERTNEPTGVAGLGPQMEIPDLYANSIFVAARRCQPPSSSSFDERTSGSVPLKEALFFLSASR